MKTVLYLVNAGFLVVVYPLDTVIGSDGSHGLWQRLGLRHHEVVKDWNDVAGGRQRARDLFVDPVPLIVVVETPIEGS